MTISTVDWDTYQAFRDLKISDPDVTAALAARGANEPVGGWTLGHVSSWGRWGTPEDLCQPIRADSEQEFSGLAPLTTSIMFLSLNWGGEKPPIDAPMWGNFHAHGHGGDTRLAKGFRSAMQATGFTAAPYMSDVFKLIPSPRATDLTRIIREEESAGRDPIGRCIRLLHTEFTMCRDANNGVAPMIVAIGNDAYQWLTGKDHATNKPVKSARVSDRLAEWLGEDPSRAVRWIPHHSGSVTHQRLEESLASVFRAALD